MTIRALFRKFGGCEEASILLVWALDSLETIQVMEHYDPGDEVIARRIAAIREFLER